MTETSRAARERHLLSTGPKRILALDGGGVRGVISLAFLERMEIVLKKRSGRDDFCLADYFDLIGGTSTGSLIAAALGAWILGRTPRDLYLALSKRGFRKRPWLAGLSGSQVRRKRPPQCHCGTLRLDDVGSGHASLRLGDCGEEAGYGKRLVVPQPPARALLCAGKPSRRFHSKQRPLAGRSFTRKHGRAQLFRSRADRSGAWSQRSVCGRRRKPTPIRRSSC